MLIHEIDQTHVHTHKSYDLKQEHLLRLLCSDVGILLNSSLGIAWQNCAKHSQHSAIKVWIEEIFGYAVSIYA